MCLEPSLMYKTQFLFSRHTIYRLKSHCCTAVYGLVNSEWYGNTGGAPRFPGRVMSKSDLKHKQELAQSRGNSRCEGKGETTARLRNCMLVQSQKRQQQETSSVKAPDCRERNLDLILMPWEAI